MRNENFMIYATLVVFVVALLISIFFALVDNSFDNRDEMLCNSALRSRNLEYLNKCECFYGGEDIRCIYDTDTDY